MQWFKTQTAINAVITNCMFKLELWFASDCNKSQSLYAYLDAIMQKKHDPAMQYKCLV